MMYMLALDEMSFLTIFWNSGMRKLSHCELRLAVLISQSRAIAVCKTTKHWVLGVEQVWRKMAYSSD